MPVHVVGNVCVDSTFQVDRFAQPGETLNARGHADGVGGKGANQAVAAARTGADVRFFAALGTDPAAAFIRERLKGELDLSTPENANDILDIVDGVIVASSLKHDVVWWNAVDPKRVEVFVAGLRR